jgi:hypothetical protein
MFEILDSAMATMRTHLGHIYAKTGLDGMISVLHHLQSISETQKSRAVIAMPIGALKRVKIPLGAFIMATAVALLFLLTDFES